MAEFVISEKEEQKNIPELAEEACRKLHEEMKPMDVKFSSSYEPATSTITIIAQALDNEKINNEFLRLFYDALTYLPVDGRGKTFHFELKTFRDFTFKDQKHHYVLETAIDRIPSEGGPTREEWEKYVKQLRFFVNGRQVEMPEPDLFIDEM